MSICVLILIVQWYDIDTAALFSVYCLLSTVLSSFSFTRELRCHTSGGAYTMCSVSRYRTVLQISKRTRVSATPTANTFEEQPEPHIRHPHTYRSINTAHTADHTQTTSSTRPHSTRVRASSTHTRTRHVRYSGRARTPTRTLTRTRAHTRTRTRIQSHTTATRPPSALWRCRGQRQRQSQSHA